MVSTVVFLAVAYVCCGLLPLALVPSVRNAGPKPGKIGVLVTLLGLAIWSIAVGLLLLETDSTRYRLFGTLFGAGGQLAAVGYFLLATEYTGALVVTRRTGYVFGTAIGLSAALSLSDPYHHLVWEGTTTPPMNEVTLGPAGILIVLATVGIAISALLLLVADVVTASGIRRRQSFVLVLAGIPTIAGYFVDFALLSSSELTLLPIGFAGSAFAYAWAIFQKDFLDIVPIGRKRIVEEMTDAAVVLDADDRVVECNPAARRIVDIGPEYTGLSVQQFFSSVPAAVDRLADDSGVDTELAATIDGDRRHFHLTVSRLDDASSVPAGRLVVLRDITALKRRERTLKRRESELEFLRQILTRVLRHNIRNDLTAVRGYADLIATEAKQEHADLAETIVETSDNLLETSRKARIIEEVIDQDPVTQKLDLTARLTDLVIDYRSTYDRATISLTAPDSCPVEADPWLEHTFDVLLENALEHAGDEPTVDVTVDRGDDETTVTIADDGPGIPPAELAVLEQGEETPLEHTSGVGLWIVHWVVDRSGASITFDTGSAGTRVSIRIPTSPRSMAASSKSVPGH
ncbi:PAS domain S-box protein [Salinadaptatus halalkaliphilus]|uniref:histidine kinase n=1 Tax=Salinadaptatus halalkaliphilus TaxID=2419781 RepID=A0A4S3TQW2_9EURY|nr:histidine kinase N-terminal 7TM domain-containing protein [Salinadaptatus halalkaliphilus]THE64948.1 PAS domain S-box protein [Salinadaptatus halalkaliphilus]